MGTVQPQNMAETPETPQPASSKEQQPCSARVNYQKPSITKAWISDLFQYTKCRLIALAPARFDLDLENGLKIPA